MIRLTLLLAFAALGLIAAPAFAQCRNGSCRVPARQAAKPRTVQRSVQQRAAWYPGKLAGFKRGW